MGYAGHSDVTFGRRPCAAGLVIACDRLHPHTDTLRRAAVVRIYDTADSTVLLAADGHGHALAGDSAALARVVLELLEQPHTTAEVRAHVEALAGGPLERPAVIDELLALLVRVGAVERGVGDPPPPARGARVLLGLTGAVASMHAPALVQRLQARGFEVRVAATADALRFVHAEALAALTHRPVVHNMWPADTDHAVPHIELAQWADAVVVAPASATTIARLATGDHSSVVAAIALATQAPVLVVPSMNPAMYAAPAVQRNLAQLAADGMHVAHPARGIEVADSPGERTPVLGGMPPPEVVVQLLAEVLRSHARGAPPPRSAAAWDRLYRVHAPTALPWHRDEPDEDLLAALSRCAPNPSSVLEIGAGTGTLAVAAARAGYRVVATDLSSTALEHAHARAVAAPVVWLQDDITATHLRGTFAVVVDRACMHLLAPEEVARYAAAVTRLTAPGGALIIKTFADEAHGRGATAYTADAIRSLFHAGFTLEHTADSSLPGPDDAPAARLFVLRRR